MHFSLIQLIGMIGSETLRLVKGEKKKCKPDFERSNNPARQIIQFESSLTNQVYFGKLAQYEFTSDSQFRYNKYLDFQKRQLTASFKSSKSKSRPVNRYV